MIGRRRISQLGGVSALAIGAAAIFAPIEARADCVATIEGPNTVDVDCTAGPTVVAPFATSYTYTTPSDGSGPDFLTITGGQILNTGLFTPEVAAAPPTFLDSSPGFINMLDGDDVVDISGGTIGAVGDEISIDLGNGLNEFSMSDGTLNGSVIGAALDADSFDMIGGTVTGSLFGLGGGNLFNIEGGTIQGSIFAGSQNDTVNVSGTTVIQFDTDIGTDSVGLEDGDDTFNMTGGTLTGSVSGGAGTDTFVIAGGTIQGSLNGNDGADIIAASGGTIFEIEGNDGNDQITITGTASIDRFVNGNNGNDIITVNGGTIGRDPSGGPGDDQIFITGGTMNAVTGDPGNDRIEASGGTIVLGITGNEGNDNISISGSASLGAIEGDLGDDNISISGGTIGDYVSGGDGNDQITVSGGTIGGDIEGETVTLTGGTIGGDITGISGDTLIIDDSLSAAPLDLRNGVLFSGTNANGTITNTDLAAGGTKTQVFSGFNSLTADNSTLGFGTGAIGIGLLTLQNGSTLFVNGSPSVSGTANVIGSTIQMIDGAADDVFTLGGIALNNAIIGIDIDQQALQADQIVAGTFSALGTNTINVNLLGTPQFTGVTDIPVIISGDPITGNFVITGVPGTTASLFTYDVVVGPDGSLYIRATPAQFEVALAPQNAVDVGTVGIALDTLYSINNDAVAADLGLANGTQAVSLTPTMSVFASGQFAHTEHDGFEISSGGISSLGPSFGIDEFSAAISLDFNAGKAFDFDPQYGLNLGLFGGYASADVDGGSYQGFTESGEAKNRSGMFGGYGLFRQSYNYALLSALGFFGKTDITNDILGTTGDYDTEGYAVTGSVGHIFMLGDKLRFDLRGGMLGVTFTGDEYTDSGGTQFGGSRISFGAFKFEPGIYADYQLENGMVISPYARADIQQRFGYSNEATIDGVEVEFDDADFSAAMSGGFNLRMTERSTLSSEIRGKWSTDSTTVSGKFGLKIAF